MLTRSWIILCLLVLAVTVFAQERQLVKPPTWPQSFTLLPGEHTSFAFPLTQAGVVTAVVKWEGTQPVTVTLTDTANHAVKTADPAASPITLTYTATAEDVRRSMLWRVMVTCPKATGKQTAPAVTGTVSIRYPEVGAAMLAKLDTVLPPALAPPASDQLLKQHRAAVVKLIADLDKPRTDRIAALKTQVTTQYQKLTTDIAARHPLVPLGPVDNNQAMTSAGIIHPDLNPVKVTAPPVRPPTAGTPTPTIVSVTPVTAASGAKITVRCKDAATDPKKNEAIFRLNSTTTISGTVLLATPTADGALDLQVEVPFLHCTQPYISSVAIKATQANATVTSDASPFTFAPLVYPAITDVTPTSAKPGDWLTITGSKFQANSEVHFLLDQNTNAKAEMQFVSATTLKAKVPTYLATATSTASVYVANVYGAQMLPGPSKPITLQPTDMNVLALNVTEAAMDCPVLITGYGFQGQPKVTVIVGGTSYAAAISQWCETGIAITVPRITRIAKSSPAQVIVECGALKSKALTFTYLPTYDHTALFIAGKPFKYDVQFGDRNVSDNQAASCDYLLYEDTIQGWHNTTKYIWFGSSGYDDYFSQITLNNGWTLEKIAMTLDPWSQSAGAYFDKTGEGTSSCRARVRWWGDMGGSVRYFVTFVATGPTGFSPYDGL